MLLFASPDLPPAIDLGNCHEPIPALTTATASAIANQQETDLGQGPAFFMIEARKYFLSPKWGISSAPMGDTNGTIGNTRSFQEPFSDRYTTIPAHSGEIMLRRLFLFVLFLSSSFAYAKTVTSVAIAPQGAVIVVGTSLQYSVTCTYSDSSTDNCAAAGGATWSTPTNAMTVSNSGLATWSAAVDPNNNSLFPSGAQTAQGMVYVTAGGLSDRGMLLAQASYDTFYTFMTPDEAFYLDVQFATPLPIDVVVGSTVTIGIGYTANNEGDGNPFQMTCNWVSSNPAIATVSRYGLATAVSPGTVTITCGQAGNGKYGNGFRTGNSFTFNVVAPAPTAQTWYVRPNGGSPYVSSTQTPAGQCDGLHDADYPGTGVNQPCAVANLRDLWADRVSPNKELWMIGPGDTVIVRQKTGGYNIGMDQQTAIYGGTAIVPINCGNPDCYMPTIPSGTASQHTRILGENYASCHADSSKSQLNVSWGSKDGINVSDSQFVDVACLEITDQAACAYNGAYTNSCTVADNQGLTGILQSALTASTTYTDIYIHGLSYEGIHGATGGNVVGNYVHIQGVPSAGIDMDDAPHLLSNISVAGGFTLNNSITEFAGCVEEYPIVHQYPYIECRDAETGAYGDGFGTASTTGTWSFDHDIWRYNFQDGLDLLHSGLQSLTVTNSLSYGNDGQSYKIGSAENVVFQNNIGLENCNRIGFVIGDEPASAIVPGVNLCRADGEWLAMQFSPSGTYKVQNNTMIGYGDVAVGYSCTAGGDNCSGANTALQNNVFLAYYDVGYNGDEESAIFCAVVNSNCNQNLNDFPANQGWATRTNNLYFNTRSCPISLTATETCNTSNPLLANQPANPITIESQMDSINYTPSASSPLVGAGVPIPGILSDYNNVPRPNPPSIGALEYAAGSSSLSPSQVTLTASPNPANSGQAVSMSVTIAAVKGVVPTGIVTFSSNGLAINSGVVNSTGVASLSTSSLASGINTLTATYSGDSNYVPSVSNTISLTVNAGPAAQTTTSLKASPTTTTVGQPATFTANVAAASGTATGTVSFLGNGVILGSAALNSGVAILSTSSLTPGSYQITAQYTGNSSFNASASSMATITVNPAAATPTTTLLQAAPTTITAGQSVLLSASSIATSTVTTGTISFFSNGALLGSAPIVSGVATFIAPFSTQGTYQLTAQLTGTSSFATSTSAPVTETVVGGPAATTTTSLLASPTTITAGQPVTLTAAVKSTSGTTTGTVFFFSNGVQLGSSSLSSGVATLVTSSLTQGTDSLTAQYTGTSSFKASTSSPITETVNAAPAAQTTTSLLASPSTITAGQSVTLTAAVKAASGTATGTVSFLSNGAVLGTATLSSGVATFTTSSLAQGSYQLTAQFTGNSSFSASTSSAITETVNAAPAAQTTTSLLASPTTITTGQSVTLTAAVKAASGTATGTVSFLSNGAVLGTATLSSGVATFTTSTLQQGSYQLTAQFTGNTSFSASISLPTTETVNPAPAAQTTTSLVTSGAIVTTGQSVTLTANVKAASGTPAGTVSFLSNGAVLGTATLSSGVATFTTSTLQQGSYQLTAQFAGNTSFNASTSFPVAETVNALPPGGTATSLLASSATITVGQSVTLTAAVKAASGTATGTVSFLSNGSALGTATLNSGVATFTTSVLAQGSYKLTAMYTGNSSFAASTSSPLVEIVNAQPAAQTATSLLASPNTITTGQSVTLTAAVKPTSGTATGTVSFLSNGAPLGTAVLSSGVATLTTSSLAQGAYQLTAQFTGNSNFSPSISAPITETVNAAAAAQTTTSLLASPSTITTGQSVTLTADVKPASGTATGTVSFISNGVLFGTAKLSSGVATLTTSSLTQGSYQFIAQYEGSSTLSASTSAPVTETVNSASAVQTTTLLQAAPSMITAGQSILLSANVVAASGNATGTVSFLSNGVLLGTATITSGTATLIAPLPTAGSYRLTAQYAGNSNFNTSTSAPLTETVNAPAAVSTTTSLLASSTTIATGQSVTLTATIKPTSGTATGTVIFLSNGAPLGTATLSSGIATLTTSSLAQGSYQLTAQYTGNSSFNPSISSPLTETVTPLAPGATTTSLQLPSTSAPQGQPVTFTATVGASSGKPSGDVSFMNGTVLLGSAPLSSAGIATYTTSSLTPGTYLLTAQYTGTSAFSPSISPTEALTVGTPGVTVTSSSPSVTLSGTQTSSAVTLTLTPIGGYSGTLQMACPNPPTGTTCTFLPQTVTVNSATGPVKVMMTVKNTLVTTSASAADHEQQPATPNRALVLSASIFWIPGVLAAALIGKKRKHLGRAGTLLLVLLLCGAFGALTGCGAGATFRTLSSSSATLNVTVTGTGNIAQSISLNVISQESSQ
jgi:Bacterial Ig-like domain (group 3)/Bacterial Ig-like domain (group 2)